MTEAQRRRALRHADIPWNEKVTDPRNARGRVHPHRGILGLLMASFAVGLVTLRRAEDLGEDLGPGARRSLGLPRKVSDSTLYRMAERFARGGRLIAFGARRWGRRSRSCSSARWCRTTCTPMEW